VLLITSREYADMQIRGATTYGGDKGSCWGGGCALWFGVPSVHSAVCGRVHGQRGALWLVVLSGAIHEVKWVRPHTPERRAIASDVLQGELEPRAMV
jgi:hypothetical protein